MVTGDFALTTGIDPGRRTPWYWLGYAGGGLLATKPFAASANYINKMRDESGSCVCDRKTEDGKAGCPFNSLFWDFLARHRRRFGKKLRMNLVMSGLDKIKPAALKSICRRKTQVRQHLRHRAPV